MITNNSLLKEQRQALAKSIKIDGMIKNGAKIHPREFGCIETQLNILYLLLVFNLQEILKKNHLQDVNTEVMADVLCQVATMAIEDQAIWSKDLVMELLETVLKA